MLQRPPRAGFNLIEAAIVLGVVGLVIGGIWVAAAAVGERQKQTRLLQQLVEIASNVRARYPAASFNLSGTFYGTTTANLGATWQLGKDGWDGVIPADMITSSDYPVNPWGGTVSLYISSALKTLEITVSGISVATCISLAPRIDAMFRTQPGYMTIEGYYERQPLNTPELAATNCPSDYDSGGEGAFIFSVPR